MILSILKSYLILLLSVGMGSLCIFLGGLYLIFRKSPTAAKSFAAISDLSAIAGDDVINTQLDLARAYIETGRKSLAVTILKFVIEQGNRTQQQEAQQLIRKSL